MPDIQALTEKVIAFREERGWTKYNTPKDLAISIALEAAEVLEHFQWKDNVAVDAYVKEYREDIADELADVLIYLLTLSHDLGIDMVDAAYNKLKKNAVKYPVDGTQRMSGT